MRLAAPAPLFLLLSAPACFGQAAAQTQRHDAALRIAGVGPYPSVAPGQIVELRVEGFEERFISPPPGDALRILLTQDGATTDARAHGHADARPRDPGDAGRPRRTDRMEGIESSSRFFDAPMSR